MKKRIKTFDLALCSLLLAIILVLTFTGLGFPKLSGIEITIIHIPVLIGAIALGRWYGSFLGLAWGLASLYLAFRNQTVDTIVFTNPLVSVFPRVLVGFIAIDIYNLFNKITKGRKIGVIITAFLATFIHSLLVITLLFFSWKYGFFFFAKDYPFPDNFKFLTLLLTLLASNFLIEVTLSCLIVSPVTIIYSKLAETENPELDNTASNEQEGFKK
ncbi:MAG: ECF transporter S component [Bacilli bacterium]|jgi:uncharacterized membrane protein